VLQEGYKLPGPDLIFKMALKERGGGWIDTFSVRYHWADALVAAKVDGRIADLAPRARSSGFGTSTGRRCASIHRGASCSLAATARPKRPKTSRTRRAKS